MNWSHPAVVGLLIAIPPFAVGLLGYLRSLRVDRATAASTIVATQSGAVGQVIDGLNKLIDNLQDDNKVWRDSFAGISTKLAEVVSERDELRAQLDALNRKFRINGA